MTGSKMDQQMHTARYLAAHAIFALRAGFPVKQIELEAPSREHGFVCDWKQVREAYGDDTKLIHRSFALAYIGGLIDQGSDIDPSEDLRAEMKADMEASEDSRETAVAWHLVGSIKETTSFAHVGYKLASRLLRKDKLLIDRLAVFLTDKRSLDEKSLLQWFQENASPYALDELETTNTY